MSAAAMLPLAMWPEPTALTAMAAAPTASLPSMLAVIAPGPTPSVTAPLSPPPLSNAQTLVFAVSDLAVTKSNGIGTYRPGDLLVYTVTVRNLGADAAAQIRVRDSVPAGLANVVWSCDASGGLVCPQTGDGKRPGSPTCSRLF